MKFTRTSRFNKCPLCGTEKSKCGAPHDNPNVRLCMTYHSKEEAPPGWKYVGETSGGQWGIFVPAGREYTEEELAAYKQRRNDLELIRRQRHIESLSER